MNKLFAMGAALAVSAVAIGATVVLCKKYGKYTHEVKDGVETHTWTFNKK